MKHINNNNNNNNKSSVKNYTPISLLCVTSKVLEKLLMTKAFHLFPDRVSLVSLLSSTVANLVSKEIFENGRGYLTSRMQCVSMYINTSISAQLPVIPGVPQGSILGPL